MSGTCWGADSNKLYSYGAGAASAAAPLRGDPGWCLERAMGREPCPPGRCRARGAEEDVYPVPDDLGRLWPASADRLHRPPPPPSEEDRARRAAAVDAIVPELERLVTILREHAAKGGISESEAAQLEQLRAWLGQLYVDRLDRRKPAGE